MHAATLEPTPAHIGTYALAGLLKRTADNAVARQLGKSFTI
jgi:hypothetical protein